LSAPSCTAITTARVFPSRRNYAATLAILDVLFGTFYYRPGRVPERLGVFEPDAYPDSNEFWRVLKLPFVSTDPI
jgi:sterol desaturase/sphingolipid hydroxylase (fatty acid hydroxylase superfamily)